MCLSSHFSKCIQTWKNWFFPIVSTDRHTLIEDDVGPESAEKPYKHIINKRDILFDIIDDQMESKEKNQVYRTTRNTDWMENYEKSSHEYFIKLLIVADKTMVQYHKTDDGLKHYILTLMSHVRLMLRKIVHKFYTIIIIHHRILV